MEQLYCVEEFCTMGWELIKDNLTRKQASELIQSLIDAGENPVRLRAVKHEFRVPT